MPTDVYEYDEAVYKDHVLVPFYLIETATQIPDDGITYKDLDDDEREAYEDEFCEDDEIYPQDDAPMEDEFVDNEVMSDVSSDISVDSDDSLSESAYTKYF